MTTDESAGAAGWYAVLRSDDAVPRHVAFARLFGEEIAVWRDDAGRLNAWENRCPHRGMRLTLGTNTGSEVKCRYHGWRFASRSGTCTAIPAHPEQTPPRAAFVRTYRCAERYGLVWIARGDAPGEPELPPVAGAATTLRSVTMHAPADAVAAALAREPRPATLTYALQPESATVTTVHGVDATERAGDALRSFLRAENARLTALRDALEALTA